MRVFMSRGVLGRVGVVGVVLRVVVVEGVN